MFCKNCGTEIINGGLFCSKCGTKIENIIDQNIKTNFVAAKCTNCGGALQVNPSQDAAICPFCKQPYIVEKAINNVTVNGNTYIQNANVKVENGPSISNLKIRAKNYENNGDIYKAIEYYNRALDLDPSDSQANEAIYQLNNKPFYQILCNGAGSGILSFHKGMLSLHKEKLIFTSKNGRQTTILINEIEIVKTPILNKKAIFIQTCHTDFNGNKIIKTFDNINSSIEANNMINAIKNAMNGKYYKY